MTDCSFPSVHPTMGRPLARWIYLDKEGEPLCAVYRYDQGQGRKVYLPYDLRAQIWKAPNPRPLYGLERLRALSGPVVLVEGEKCADALNELGIDSVSCFGGSNAVQKNDLSPLHGREIVIWPDADEAGAKYALLVGQALEGLAESVSVIPVNVTGPGRNPGEISLTGFEVPFKGWDVADAVNGGWSRLRIRDFLKEAVPYVTYRYMYTLPKEHSLLKKGSPLRNVREEASLANLGAAPKEEWPAPDMSILNPEAKRPVFPIEVLGPFWGQWVRETAEAVSAPPDYVAGALLASIGGLIGNARWVSPWEGWREPPIIWMALVGSPSSGKSPAIDPVLDLIGEIEKELMPGHEEALRQYETDRLAAELAKESWKQDAKVAAKGGYAVPLMPEKAEAPIKPERPRLKVSDVTIEALGNLLASQPKGIIFTRDELAGWLGNFDRYGGKGGDRAFWLEAYGGRSYVMERVKHDGKPVNIEHLSVGILGGIQPDRLQTLLMKGDDDGLTARFLYVCPQSVPPERPNCIPSKGAALHALRRLVLLRGQDGDSDPVTLRLTGDASDLFQDWRKIHFHSEPDGRRAGWWGKCPGMALRLSLIIQMLWWAGEQDSVAPSEVSLIAIDAAIRLVDEYYKQMAMLVYEGIGGERNKLYAARLAEAILERKAEIINIRNVYRNWRVPGLLSADSVQAAAAQLEEAGWIRSKHCPNNPTGGRPRGDYQVSPKL